jgi:hypothetical protein
MIRYFKRGTQSVASLVAGSIITTNASDVGNVVGATARHRIASAPAGLGIFRAAIETSRRQTFSVHCFFEDARDLLRERAMFGGCAATQ